jgi:hypothetical protein
MKKTILIVGAFLAIQLVNAQEIAKFSYFGNGGASATVPHLQEFEDEKGKMEFKPSTGYFAEVGVQFNPISRIGIMAGLNYTVTNLKTIENFGQVTREAQIETGSLQMPILVKLKLGKMVMGTGITFSYLTSAFETGSVSIDTLKTSSSLSRESAYVDGEIFKSNVKSGFKNLEAYFSSQIGIEFDLKVVVLTTFTRFNLGLGDSFKDNNSSDFDWKNKYVLVGAGIRF